MDEKMNNQDDLNEIISNMENIDNEPEVDVPLFDNIAIETPFQNTVQPEAKVYTTPAAPATKISEPIDGEYTIIGKSTIIDSNLTCGGNIKVNGQIKGCVVVSGSAYLYGSVEGDITANDVTLKPGSKVYGNIICKADINAEAGSTVKGNLSAKNAYISSSVEGNVETSVELKIASTGSIIGNIATANISVQSGALINGNMTIKR